MRAEARRLGFFRVGIAPAGAAPHHDFYLRWLEENRHGDMAYLLRQARKRRDPRQVYPKAASVLVAGINYFQPSRPGDSPLLGRISRYAWGEDYHGVVRRRLEALLQIIRKMEPSAEGLCYVDTGPVAEKAWGARTDLGWIGKHTNLISRDRGSWIFLGVILLNIPLEPDAGAGNYCGTCRRCIDACPTGAIVAPYVLDARRCISYLTIECRAMIPRRLRPAIGNRIFGCDDCQEVCPWNRFAQETSVEAFLAPRESGAPELIPLAGITLGEFKRRYGNSPVSRATRDGFVRNVLTAMGNSKRHEFLPAVERALSDPGPLVRASAAWALGEISPERARSMLPELRRKESDPMVLEEISRIVF
ncbi:MAG: tRNA epoxyqueuosine(34) reductase QueG [Acidobacteria bacterium]|nr:tRNA epoxyqueuosine(34) reductase QueG [Acidobacteriota bacterium]